MSTSVFLFNAQIENPPKGFIKLAEELHKNFLWTGVAKIAHHTIISNYKSGGIKYKDLNSVIAANNLKFIQTMADNNSRSSHQVLPNYWMRKMFKIPTNMTEQPYFYDFFENKMRVLNCLVKIPRKANYSGHPFYYDILKTYEALTQKISMDTENILSLPIWFNRSLQTKFDPEISMAGFNTIQDLYPEKLPTATFNGWTEEY